MIPSFLLADLIGQSISQSWINIPILFNRSQFEHSDKREHSQNNHSIFFKLFLRIKNLDGKKTYRIIKLAMVVLESRSIQPATKQIQRRQQFSCLNHGICCSSTFLECDIIYLGIMVDKTLSNSNFKRPEYGAPTMVCGALTMKCGAPTMFCGVLTMTMWCTLHRKWCTLHIVMVSLPHAKASLRSSAICRGECTTLRQMASVIVTSFTLIYGPAQRNCCPNRKPLAPWTPVLSPSPSGPSSH